MSGIQSSGLIAEVLARSMVTAGGNFAYLDPGSGSYLLQLLIAGVMGGLLMLRIYWSKVLGFFKGIFGASIDDDEE